MAGDIDTDKMSMRTNHMIVVMQFVITCLLLK